MGPALPATSVDPTLMNVLKNTPEMLYCYFSNLFMLLFLTILLIFCMIETIDHLRGVDIFTNRIVWVLSAVLWYFSWST